MAHRSTFARSPTRSPDGDEWAGGEFIFYERLEGVEPGPSRKRASRPSTRRRTTKAAAPEEPEEEAEVAPARSEDTDLGVLVTQTLAGLERSSGGPVYASTLK